MLLGVHEQRQCSVMMVSYVRLYASKTTYRCCSGYRFGYRSSNAIYPLLFILRQIPSYLSRRSGATRRSGGVDTTRSFRECNVSVGWVATRRGWWRSAENDGWKPLLAWDLQVDVKLFSSPQRSSRRSGCAPAIHLLAVARCSRCPPRTSGTARTRAGTSPRPLEEKTNWYHLSGSR